jgi:hypothetical protein
VIKFELTSRSANGIFGLINNSPHFYILILTHYTGAAEQIKTGSGNFSGFQALIVDKAILLVCKLAPQRISDW